MVGEFGEVVLMDWGVAKVMRRDAAPDARDTREDGAAVGTPAYMSPEQVSGRNSELDERSDLYSATVLFHELLAVQHYLGPCTTYQQVMFAIMSEEFSYTKLVFLRHPQHPVPPAELLHFIARGLRKDPERRFQSADEMIAELQTMRDGRCRISCPATLAKRMINTVGNFVNHYPKLSPFVFFSALLSLILYIVVSAHVMLTRAL